MTSQYRKDLTDTEDDQRFVEKELSEFLNAEVKPLLKEKHTQFLVRNISHGLNEASQGLNCSRPWLVYWTLHAADVLGVLPQLYAKVTPQSIADFLMLCWSEMEVIDGLEETYPSSENEEALEEAKQARYWCGGFGGGPTQMPHLAPTYAAVSSFAILSNEGFVDRIPALPLRRWLNSLRSPRGSFRMHTGGETDVRAIYCALVIGTLMGLPDLPQLFPQSVSEYVASVQTFEGGFGCEAIGGTEAHGGYTQCGAAALLLLTAIHEKVIPPHSASDDESDSSVSSSTTLSLTPLTKTIDVDRLRDWCARRQMADAGGFNGRTNKLVDSCYSFWVGSSAALTDVIDAKRTMLRANDDTTTTSSSSLALTLRDVQLLDYAQIIDLSCMQGLDANQLATPFCASTAPAATSLGKEEHDKETPDALEGEVVTADAEGHVEADGEEEGHWIDEGEGAATRFNVREGPDGLDGAFFFNQLALQHYVMQCCQNPKLGGLQDKPSYPNDAYHTCYSLSGCSIALNNFVVPNIGSSGIENGERSAAASAIIKESLKRKVLPTRPEVVAQGYRVSVNPEDKGLSFLTPINPIFNLNRNRVRFMLMARSGRPFL